MPCDALHWQVLLKNDGLNYIIDLEGGRSYSTLSLLLCFHHKYLLPVYIDRVIKETSPQKSELYFRYGCICIDSFEKINNIP